MSKKSTAIKKKINCKLKSGDEVIIICGRDKKKPPAKIKSIDRKNAKIVIPGLNMVKKHRRRSQDKETGEIVEIPTGIDISNVMIYCPQCKKGVRVRVLRENKKKQRICHRCGHQFDKK